MVVAVVPAVVAIVLAGVVAVGLTRFTAAKAASDDLAQSVQNLAQLAEAVPNLFSGTQPQEALARRRLIGALLRVEEADLFPIRNGAVVVTDTSPLQFARPLDLAALQQGQTLSGRATTADGRQVMYAAHIVFPRRPALTSVVVARRDVPRGTLERGGLLLIAALVAAALAVSLAVVLGRRLGHPLRQLSAAAASVAGGEYGRQVRTNVGGEIGALAQDFNAMSEQLAESRRREREFIMDVSHDLRTPLTSIQGYAEGIADGTIPDLDGKTKAAQVIVGEAGRLERLVGDLLSLERLEAGQMGFVYEEVELGGFLREVLDGPRPGFEGAGVALSLAVPAHPVMVTTDPDRLAQVMGNLLDNALRYSPVGSEVGVELRSSGAGGAEIRVADQGPGISSDDLPHVFDRLYVSSHYPGERTAGSGLGLAIVARIMSALGGRVEVESRPPGGTAFRLTLPAVASTSRQG